MKGKTMTQRFFDDHERLHNDHGPAEIEGDGTRRWYCRGKLHREGGLPAVIYGDGTAKYFVHGQLHREGDLPACIYNNGSQKFYHRGLLHRENGKPAVIFDNGQLEFWVLGDRVNEDGTPYKEEEKPEYEKPNLELVDAEAEVIDEDDEGSSGEPEDEQ